MVSYWLIVKYNEYILGHDPYSSKIKNYVYTQCHLWAWNVHNLLSVINHAFMNES